MKKTIKRNLILCMCLLCFALSFTVGASRPQTRYVSVPSTAVFSDSVALFPGEDHSFYLLSWNSSHTRLSRFDANTTQFIEQLSEPVSYTASAQNQDTLLIASSAMQFDPQQQEFVRFTALIQYSMLSNTWERLVIPNLYLSSSLCFALDQKGFFYTVDSESPNTLLVFDSQGILQHSIPCDSPLSSVTVSPMGTRLLLTDSENRFFYLDYSDLSVIHPLSTPAPALPYHFLDETGYVDGLGDVYWEDGPENYKLAYSTLCSPHLVDMLDQSVLCIPENGPLLHLDRCTGEAAAQQELSEGALQLRLSGTTAAVLLSDSSGFRIGCIDLTSPNPLEPIVYSPVYNTADPAGVSELWQKYLPENRKNSGVYTRTPDLETFSHPSGLSSQALTDGLNAVNFYRTLWGLPPAELDLSGCEELSYGAVLSLLGNGTPPEEPPTGMPVSFYDTAQNALMKSSVLVHESLTPYPLAQAVHQWFKTDPSIRALLLSTELSHLSFGAASGENGITCVLISGQSVGQSTVTAFPPGGIFPLTLCNRGTWSVRLNEDLLAGARGFPRVVITSRETGEERAFTMEHGLTYGDGILVWEFPCKEGLYSIRVENLCTPKGIPALISYNLSLVNMDLSLPLPEEEPTLPPITGGLESDLYHIDRQRGLIYGITPSTSRSSFGKNLSGEGTIEVWKNGRPATSGNAGTGMKAVLLREGQVVDELTLLVYGDLTGEGNVNTLDLRALYKQLLEQQSLSEPFLWAADLNRDGELNTLDLLAMDKFLSGTYDIPQD